MKIVFGLLGLAALIVIVGISTLPSHRTDAPVTAIASAPSRAEQIALMAKSPKTAKAAKLCELHQDWPLGACEAVVARKIHIGMTTAQVRASWGKPEHVNRTVNQYGHSEQWVYSCQYVYFEDDDKVSSFQNSGCSSQ